MFYDWVNCSCVYSSVHSRILSPSRRISTCNRDGRYSYSKLFERIYYIEPIPFDHVLWVVWLWWCECDAYMSFWWWIYRSVVRFRLTLDIVCYFSVELSFSISYQFTSIIRLLIVFHIIIFGVIITFFPLFHSLYLRCFYIARNAQRSASARCALRCER